MTEEQNRTTNRRQASNSLGTRIIVWFFVPTAIILIAVALVTFYAYQRVTEELVIERDQELTRLNALQLSADMEGMIDLLDSISRSAAIYEGDVLAQQDTLRAAESRLSPFDGGVYILDTFGVVTASIPIRSNLIGDDWSGYPFYRKMLQLQIEQSPRPLVTDLTEMSEQVGEAVGVQVPILGENDEFLGIVLGLFQVGSVDPENALYNSIRKMRIGGSGTIYLLDSNLQVIYHSNPDKISEDFSQSGVLQALSIEEPTAMRMQTAGGGDSVASTAPIPNTPWNLVVEEDWDVLTTGSQNYQSFLLLLLALGVIIPAFVVAFGIRRLMKPIDELIEGSKAIAEGRFGQRIHADTGDEIEELADQFNLMSAQLEESYSTLEQRVADRTSELSALYSIASVLSRSLDLDEILAGALIKTIEVMEVEAGGIYLLDPAVDLLKVVVHRGFSDALIEGIDELKVGEGFSGRVAETGRSMVINDLTEDPRLTRSIVTQEGFHSVTIAPLVSGGRVHGTIFLATKQLRDFQPQEVELLTTIGQQIAGAIQNARLLEAEERRAEQFRVISRVGSQITSILDVDELLSELARLIHESFPYYLVEIGFVEGDELVFRSGAGGTWEKEFESFRLDIAKSTVTTWVAKHGEPLLIPDVRTDPRYTRVTEVESRSELALPLKVKNKVIGVLNVESDRLDGFDQSDLSVLSSLASQAAIAIDNARLVEGEKRRADQFQVISQVGSQITAILDVDELLDEISHLIKGTFGYYLVTIGLVEGDQLVFRAGLKSQWDQPNFIPPAIELDGQGITAWVASHGEPLIVNDIESDTRFKYLETTSETRSELAVPLKTKSGVIGVLNVESDRLDAFDESDMILLQTLAQQAAIAIENAELYEQARELAVIEERNRLARDLHDSVSQTLFSSSLIAEVLPRLWQRDPGEGTKRLEELRLLSRGALAEMRTLLLELRPAALMEADIRDLLQQLAESAQARGQVPVRLKVDGDAEMPEAVKIAVYHISQEALNNIIKHAGAQEIELELLLNADRVELSVTDDGTGFIPSQRSPEQLGLTIMQERADSVGGTLDLTSQPSQGTTIRFLWTEGDG